jgi:hypothetical protein
MHAEFDLQPRVAHIFVKPSPSASNHAITVVSRGMAVNTGVPVLDAVTAKQKGNCTVQVTVFTNL